MPTGGVQTTWGGDQSRREALRRSILSPASVGQLDAVVARRWTATWERRHGQGPVALLDLAADVLCAAAFEWVGLPVRADAVPQLARDLAVAADPAGRRGRRARRRLEARLGAMTVEHGHRAPAGSAVGTLVRHADPAGRALPPRSVALELLELLRAVTAIAWPVAHGARALHLHPEWRARVVASGHYREAFVHEVRRTAPGSSGEEGAGRFRPDRFLDRRAGPLELSRPLGAADHGNGHAGEHLAASVLGTVVRLLAASSYSVVDRGPGGTGGPSAGDIVVHPTPAPATESAARPARAGHRPARAPR